MIDLGFAIFVALVSCGVGLRLPRRLGELPDDPIDRVALAIPLGWACLRAGNTCPGRARSPQPSRSIVTARRSSLNSVYRLGTAHYWPFANGLIVAAASVHRPFPANRWIAIWPIIAMVGTAITAVGPVTDGDVFCYHLQVPKVFLMAGSVGFAPDLHETVYPLVTELLYAVALEFRGPVACRGIQWILGLVFAANVIALARPCLRPAPGGPADCAIDSRHLQRDVRSAE